MSHKIILPEEGPPINIMPLMNIIMLLIPFLIMSTEFIKLSVINVTSPHIVGDQKVPSEQSKQKLNLTIALSEKGITLLTKGYKITTACRLKKTTTQSGTSSNQEITINKVNGHHNLHQLTQCLQKVKKLFPKEKSIIIMATSGTSYKTIISVMDASRTDDKKQELFPQVHLSPGVI